ncbi:MAG: MerR family transcriptional regulator [Candidatus Omnitrophica bacterium]|nr:MerR family transcriptional regulator [Candidatus Omnitrophota bacterium]
MVAQHVVSAQEVASSFKITVSLINFYTNLGLLEVFDRKGRGNKRYYLLPAVEHRLQIINEMKRRGFPLRLIQESLHREQS